MEKHPAFSLKPRLLYVGFLEKHRGWKEEPHFHDFLEILFVTDGQVQITIEDKAYNVSKGDLIIYNAGVQHSERSNVSDPAKILFVAYDGLQITDLPPNWLIPASYDYAFHSGKMYDIFYTYFNILIKEFELKDNFYTEIAQNVSRTLLMYVLRLINHTKNTSALLDSSKIIETALSYIEENFRDKITLDDLAEACFTNKFYISHLFTRIQNVSIGKYIVNRRIEEAKLLLSDEDLSIASIAEQTGFIDPGYFCRAFKKNTGLTPSDYRKTIFDTQKLANKT